MLLFRQEKGLLRNMSSEAGPAFTKALAARGLTVGDFDNDGFPDVLVATNGGAPVLLRNRCGSGNHWLGLKLEGVNCNRDAIGARISWSAGGRCKAGGAGFRLTSRAGPRRKLHRANQPGRPVRPSILFARRAVEPFSQRVITANATFGRMSR